ncbi:hypothetical protein IMSHALPRED_008045 [Imshaugia aleurites]|uniref:DUF1748-domain-containing protein n=1 Tax=Imshaugia aleurites TaxID=172621 RepID=A0A8H3FYT6_9LECA|nr:hypothetical protein IMSHALPRED_008045 [Imshaugia aleurites]
MVFGRVVHYAFDAVLVSAFLAGVKRSTGLTYAQPQPKSFAKTEFESDKISESKELKKWVDSYLGMGEWVMDQSVAILGSSGYFERRR